MEIVSTGLVTTGVTAVETDAPATAETPLAWIEYVLLTIVPDVAVTATVKETVLPVRQAPRTPMFQVTTPEERVPPSVAETKVVIAEPAPIRA